MNIETNQKIVTAQLQNQTTSKTSNKTEKADFADELKNISKEQETQESEKVNQIDKKETSTADTKKDDEKISKEKEEKGEGVENAIDVLEGAVKEIHLLNRTDENDTEILQLRENNDDKKNRNEELGLIDNNMNIQEPKDKLNAQMNANMNFNSDGQPFAEFVNQNKTKEVLRSTEKDLAEEKAILSTMEENIAIANKNMAMKDSKTKTVINEHGITKVDKKTDITVDIIANFDSVIMNKNDVDFFAKLANGEIVNLNEIETAQKSSAVSKTLADLLAKSMNENKPVRIDFDNDISVIIKISKDGKISADFLPSSNIAEAYLRENLPLLKQKFDDNNIDYEELNQRKQKQNDNQDDRKKGRKDE